MCDDLMSNVKYIPKPTETNTDSDLDILLGHSYPEESILDWKDIADQPDVDTIYDDLRKLFPYGHEQFTKLTIDELKLHSDKNFDYAHGGNALGNFLRVSKILEMYPGLRMIPPVIALVYAMKQLDAVLWQLSGGYEGQVEGIQDKAQDIHVYVKLFRILLEEQDV